MARMDALGEVRSMRRVASGQMMHIASFSHTTNRHHRRADARATIRTSLTHS